LIGKTAIQQAFDKNFNQDQKPGRKRIKKEIRELIYQMAEENGVAEPFV
jgi:hypothetical protein